MDRYSRHKDLFTKEQFNKIRESSVMVAGAGGLGSSVLQLLARLGVGKLYIYDYAKVDLPDLNRQILYSEKDIGEFKVYCAKNRLSEINNGVEVIVSTQKIDKSIQIPEVDIVIDCLDNFEARFVLDDLLYPNGIPLIHGGVSKYFAQVTSIVPKYSKSLKELFPIESSEVDNVASKDIFPSVVTTTASIQVSEAIKYLTLNIDNMLINRVLSVDLLNNTFDILDFK